MKKQIVIADDQNLFAEGIKQLLEQDGDITVSQIVQSGGYIDAVVKHNKPDVLLLDLNMPKKNGFEVLKEIRSKYPELTIAVLSTYDNLPLTKKAQSLGANAYLSKDATIEELRTVIFKTHNQDFFLSREILEKTKVKTVAKDNFFETVKISNREKQVVKLIIKGHSSKEIAKILSISLYTVKTHRKNLFKKLNVNKVSELIKVAYDNKLA